MHLLQQSTDVLLSFHHKGRLENLLELLGPAPDALLVELLGPEVVEVTSSDHLKKLQESGHL